MKREEREKLSERFRIWSDNATQLANVLSKSVKFGVYDRNKLEGIAIGFQVASVVIWDEPPTKDDV